MTSKTQIKNPKSQIPNPSSQVIARLTEKKNRLDAHRPLPSGVAAKLDEYFGVEWTYNSNAIEGSSITLGETRAILLDGITVNGKPLREHLEVINHSPAIDFVQELGQGRGDHRDDHSSNSKSDSADD